MNSLSRCAADTTEKSTAVATKLHGRELSGLIRLPQPVFSGCKYIRSWMLRVEALSGNAG